MPSTAPTVNRGQIVSPLWGKPTVAKGVPRDPKEQQQQAQGKPNKLTIPPSNIKRRHFKHQPLFEQNKMSECRQERERDDFDEDRTIICQHKGDNNDKQRLTTPCHCVARGSGKGGESSLANRGPQRATTYQII